MHGGYGIKKLNDEAVRHHEAIVKLNAEHAEKVSQIAADRRVGSSVDVNGTEAQKS